MKAQNFLNKKKQAIKWELTNTEAKNLAIKNKLDNRIKHILNIQPFIKLKCHKDNFATQPTCKVTRTKITWETEQAYIRKYTFKTKKCIKYKAVEKQQLIALMILEIRKLVHLYNFIEKISLSPSMRTQ